MGLRARLAASGHIAEPLTSPTSVSPALPAGTPVLSKFWASLFPERPRIHCSSQIGQGHGLSVLQEARRREADDMTLELRSLSIKVNTTYGVMVWMFQDTGWCGTGLS